MHYDHMASLEIMSPNIVCKYMLCILYDVFSEINYYYYYILLYKTIISIVIDINPSNNIPKMITYYDRFPLRKI